LTEDEAVLVTQKPELLRLKLLGAKPGAKVTGLDELPGKSNYFIGNDPNKWRTHVPTFGRVQYESIYPGVDLVYYGNEGGQLEYDFIVAPRADPSAIRLAIEAGSQAGSRQKAVGSRQKAVGSVRIAANGDLIVTTESGEVRFHKPVVYQTESRVESQESRVESKPRTTDHGRRTSSKPRAETQDPELRQRTTDDGQRTSVNPKSKIQNPKLIDAHYVLKSDGQVTFEIAPYDTTRPLIIDPILSYSTYLGGSDMDYANGIAVDSSGNAYVTGYTASTDFPLVNPVQSSPGGGTCSDGTDAVACFDAFVTKLSPTGTALVYSTYLGGSNEDYGVSIAVDASGDAYVTGYTNSTNFPVAHALQTQNAGGFDAFVTELSANGESLIYSTYYGGSSDDIGTGIAVDSSGNAYISGYTDSSNFPVTSGAFQVNYGGAVHNGFVVKFNSGGAALDYATFLGASGDDYAYGVVVDSAGDAYVTGATNSTNFPTANAFQPDFAGGLCGAAPNTFPCYDAFVAKLNPAGSALDYSTYLGGTGSDYGYAIALDGSSNAYVTGYTTSTNFPTTAGAFQQSFGGSYDVFVAKLDSGGSALGYSTYLGGSGTEVGYGIAVDSCGRAFVTGYNYGGDFPTVLPLQAQNAGYYDAFVSVLNASGSSLAFSTYLGGSQDDVGRGISLDPSGNAYIAGATFSLDFPTTSGSFQPSYGGGPYDAFVAEVSLAPSPSLSISPASLTFGSQALGTTSAPQNATLTNVGAEGLVVTDVVASGDFAESNTCVSSSPLASNGTCSVSVTFAPTATRARTGTLAITDNATIRPQTVSLTGTGAGPAASLSPTSLYFGNQADSTTSAAETVMLCNTGTLALNVTNVTIAGTNGRDFAETNNCGTSVAAGASCTFSVTFTPAAAGSRTGTLTITDDASPATQTVSLTGTGAAPAVSLSPTSLTFLAQAMGTSSAQSVTLSNTGSATLSISSITVSGDFSQTNTCGSSVAASANCTISVTFNPTTSGTRTGTLTVTDDASPATQTVSLTGTAVAPVASLSPTSLTFPAQAVGTSSAQSVTLSNTGSATLSISSITVSGDFSQTNTCGSSVAASASCAISVTFTPTAAGSRTGTLTITDNVSPTTQTVSLTGTGAAPAVSLSPTSLTFPAQALGTTSSAQSVTLSNTGSATLVISSATASGDFSQTNTCGSSVAASASCTISVTFTPTAAGSRTGTLTITDNVSPTTQTVSLTGTGAAPAVSLSPTSLTFPAQAVGTSSSAQRVTLSNTGSATLSISSITVGGNFSQTNTCGSSVAASVSCAISVTFTPTISGTRTGSVTITDNATGSPQAVTVTGTGEDFAFNVPLDVSTSATISPGGTAAYTLGVVGLGGFDQNVNFTCTGAPAEATCTVSPSSLTLTSSTTSLAVQVTTTAPSVGMPRPISFPPVAPLQSWPWLLWTVALAALGSLARATRRWAQPGVGRGRAGLVTFAVLSLMLGAMAACGGGGGGGGGAPPQSDPGTPSGTYTLTVTGTYGSGSTTLTHSVDLTLQVQ
jgi:hypothetical protein